MNLEGIRIAVETAEAMLQDLDGDSPPPDIGPAEVFLHTSRAKVELDHAKVRSDEQLFVRRCILGHVEALERRALGTLS